MVRHSQSQPYVTLHPHKTIKKSLALSSNSCINRIAIDLAYNIPPRIARAAYYIIDGQQQREISSGAAIRVTGVDSPGGNARRKLALRRRRVWFGERRLTTVDAVIPYELTLNESDVVGDDLFFFPIARSRSLARAQWASMEITTRDLGRSTLTAAAFHEPSKLRRTTIRTRD